MAFRDHGLHFIGNVKTAHSLFPKSTILNFAPMKHGHTIVYEAVVKGHKLFAIGIRKGGKRVRMLIATCGTTIVTGTQEWSAMDEHGHRTKVSKPRCDVDALYSMAQPAVDVHNKLRQKSLGVEKSWGTKSYEQRAHATAAGVMCVDGFNICRTMTPHGLKLYKPDSLIDHTNALIFQLLNNPFRSDKLKNNARVGNARFGVQHNYDPTSVMVSNPMITPDHTDVQLAEDSHWQKATYDEETTPVQTHQLMSFKQYKKLNPTYVCGAKQQWCCICKKGTTSFFCITCGPLVPVHRSSSSSKHNTCEAHHRRNIHFRAVKRAFRASAPRGKRKRTVDVSI